MVTKFKLDEKVVEFITNTRHRQAIFVSDDGQKPASDPLSTSKGNEASSYGLDNFLNFFGPEPKRLAAI